MRLPDFLLPKRVRIARDEEMARLQAVYDRHRWQLGFGLIVATRYRRFGTPPYGGTVPRHVIKKRRRKNKAARAARRLNRG